VENRKREQKAPPPHASFPPATFIPTCQDGYVPSEQENESHIEMNVQEATMATVPIAVGLTICDYVIKEAKTGKPTLVGCFSSLRVQEFPCQLPPFSLFASLTDGLGDVTIETVVTRLETGEEVANYQQPAKFSEPLAEFHFHLRLKRFVVAEAGTYQFMLMGNGEWIAQRRLHIH
jgi:uncharacterized protein DUF6941